MTQRQAIWLAMRIRPRAMRRRSAWVIANRLYGYYANAKFAVTDPATWWFCRRVKWHFRYGLPLPKRYLAA